VNAAAYVLLAAFAVVAPANWLTRRPGHERGEAPTKLGAIGLLVALALVVTPVDDAVRAWFVAALVLSAAGDAFLLAGDRSFLPGLASFLLAHLAYVVGIALVDTWRWAGLVAGIAGSAVLFAVVGRRILAASGGLRIPVACYLVAILTMATLACASLPAVGVVGALLFVASDSLLGWRMFVVERARTGAAAPPWMPPAIMATYHVGQLLLVLSLVVA
jgi:uncharacterized membrane protein YhhN